MTTPAQTLESDRFQFPGMAPREILIWRAWLALHQKDYIGFHYNVRIGNGSDPGETPPEEYINLMTGVYKLDRATAVSQWPTYREQYIRNTQKRIDAVGTKQTGQEIIEVKDRATASSMSQLLTYKALWPITFPSVPVPALVLVTNRVSADMPLVLQASGIRLDLVPDVDFSILRAAPRPGAPPPKG